LSINRNHGADNEPAIIFNKTAIAVNMMTDENKIRYGMGATIGLLGFIAERSA